MSTIPILPHLLDYSQPLLWVNLRKWLRARASITLQLDSLDYLRAREQPIELPHGIGKS